FPRDPSSPPPRAPPEPSAATGPPTAPPTRPVSSGAARSRAPAITPSPTCMATRSPCTRRCRPMRSRACAIAGRTAPSARSTISRSCPPDRSSCPSPLPATITEMNTPPTSATHTHGSTRDREIVDARVIVTSPGRNFVTLKIVTRAGISGLGDATLNGRELAVASYLGDHVVPNLIGRDAGRIEDIWQFLYRGAYWRRGPVTMSAIAAVDVALWDILGKMA